MPSGGKRSTSWKPGQAPKSHRPKGAKDKVPRSLKASIRAICRAIGTEKPEVIERALLEGIKARPPKSFQYLQLWAHYTDGKPGDGNDLPPGADRAVRIIYELQQP